MRRPRAGVQARTRGSPQARQRGRPHNGEQLEVEVGFRLRRAGQATAELIAREPVQVHGGGSSSRSSGSRFTAITCSRACRGELEVGDLGPQRTQIALSAWVPAAARAPKRRPGAAAQGRGGHCPGLRPAAGAGDPGRGRHFRTGHGSQLIDIPRTLSVKLGYRRAGARRRLN